MMKKLLKQKLLQSASLARKITANTTDKWMMKYSKVPTDCRDCAMFLELQDQLYLI